MPKSWPWGIVQLWSVKKKILSQKFNYAYYFSDLTQSQNQNLTHHIITHAKITFSGITKVLSI